MSAKEVGVFNIKYFHLRLLTPSAVIIGIDLHGPLHAAEALWGWTPRVHQLPKLRNLSDILWGYWHWNHYQPGGGRVDHLNAYIVYGIENSETRRIIKRAFQNRGVDGFGDWPAQYFPIESDEGLALLGEFTDCRSGGPIPQAQHKLISLQGPRLARLSAIF